MKNISVSQYHIYSVYMLFINSVMSDGILSKFSIKNKAISQAVKWFAHTLSRDPSRGNPTTLPAVTLNSRRKLALWQPAGVATLYSLAGYFDSSARESLRSNRPIRQPPLGQPSCHPGKLRIRILAIRDILVRLDVSPSPPLPSVSSLTPAIPVRRPSCLGRISRYPLDVAHRFESVFESWNRGAREEWRGEGVLETGFRKSH